MVDYEQKVRELLCEALGNDSPLDLDDRADLAPCGMDSINCIKLIIAMESAFEIEIPDDRLGMRYVRNVFDICNLVEEVTDNG